MPEQQSAKTTFVKSGTNSMALVETFKIQNPEKDYVVTNGSQGSRIDELDKAILPAGSEARFLTIC